MKYQIPKGLFDIQPHSQEPSDAWRIAEYWQYLEETLRKMARNYGFSEIRTPIFEKTELFTRSAGDTSDIVFKEMYTFKDKADRSMTLRPEGTAPVMRALVESATLHENPVQKLFYFGPYFRYDRPQAGRYRQFHQFGIEAIGLNDPDQDAEVIELLYRIFEKLGIQKLNLLLNSIGTPEARSKYCQALLDYFTPLKSKLSEDSQARLEANPLRILDSKSKDDIALVKNAPTITQFLDSESKNHLDQLKAILDRLKIPYQIEPRLMRGLDYYNKTVFEFTSGDLGAQNTIGAGGRYDGLIGKLGGADLPAFGFAAGLERILLTMLGQEATMPQLVGPDVLLIPLGEQARLEALPFASMLRQADISTDIYLKNKKVQKAFQYGEKIKARYALVLGDDELASQKVTIKDLSSRDQHQLAVDDLIAFIRQSR